MHVRPREKLQTCFPDPAGSQSRLVLRKNSDGSSASFTALTQKLIPWLLFANLPLFTSDSIHLIRSMSIDTAVFVFNYMV